MAEKWAEEEDDSSTPPTSPAVVAVRRKFEDEENENDILDSWDAAEDSEVEREKARLATEQKEKAEKEAAANKKSKTQRIAEKQAEKARKLAEKDDNVIEEDAAARRERLQNVEIASDMKHSEDLFGSLGASNNRKISTAANVVQLNPNDPTSLLDLTTLPLFNPADKLQFEKLRDTLLPIISQNSNKAFYIIFLQDFIKQLAKELPSEQIKKIASTLTALSNEKMKEEKLAEKGGKKSKAAKTKVALVATKNFAATSDVHDYDDDYGDDDFM